ncbi:MAG: DMT family transporter [Clostridia bacterium]|nr:DMT family transporter [Clostridia bacterium]
MKEKNKKQFIGMLALFVTALIWGLSFIAQSEGMTKIGPFTFSAVRQLLGGMCLMVFIVVRDLIKVKKMTHDEKLDLKEGNKRVLIYGCIIGVVFFIATNMQQFAFLSTKPSKIAFITSFYIFFVTIFGLFMGKRPFWMLWIGVGLGILGLFFICIGPNGFGHVKLGDFLSLGCSVFFAIQIMFAERMAPHVDVIKLSAVQFIFSGTVSTVCMFIFEKPVIADILSVSFALIFSGVFSVAIAYTLQLVGQKYTDATIASLIMCLESVFATIAESVYYKTFLTRSETIGCVIMLLAIVIAQLSEPVNTKLRQAKEKKVRNARQSGGGTDEN